MTADPLFRCAECETEEWFTEEDMCGEDGMCPGCYSRSLYNQVILDVPLAHQRGVVETLEHLLALRNQERRRLAAGREGKA